MDTIDPNISPLVLKEAMFLYKAINDGWTIWKNSKGEYEMIKDKKNIKGNVEKDKFERKFVERYIGNN